MPANMPVETIIWVDSARIDGPTETAPHPVTVFTTGFRCKETDDHVAMAQDYCPEADKSHRYQNIVAILKANILGRKVLS